MQKPLAKNFNTNDGMHAAMRAWAAAQNKPAMQVTVLYSDSDDKFVEVFERAQKEITYKTPDGETYTQTVDSGKFINSFILGSPDEMGITELKKAFSVWAGANLMDGVAIVSIKWEKV